MASVHQSCKNKNMNPLRGDRTLGQPGCLMANTVNGETHQKTQSEIWTFTKTEGSPEIVHKQAGFGQKMRYIKIGIYIQLRK